MKVLFAVCILALSLPAFGQAIPTPSNPVAFCGTQASPSADAYQLIFDGGAPESLTMDSTKNPACPAGSTHSFSVAASRFVPGQHVLMVRGVNPFGATDGPVYVVTVGVAPGQFTIDTMAQ